MQNKKSGWLTAKIFIFLLIVVSVFGFMGLSYIKAQYTGGIGDVHSPQSGPPCYKWGPCDWPACDPTLPMGSSPLACWGAPICTPGATESCAGGGTKTCNLSGFDWGPCVGECDSASSTWMNCNGSGGQTCSVPTACACTGELPENCQFHFVCDTATYACKEVAGPGTSECPSDSNNIPNQECLDSAFPVAGGPSKSVAVNNDNNVNQKNNNGIAWYGKLFDVPVVNATTWDALALSGELGPLAQVTFPPTSLPPSCTVTCQLPPNCRVGISMLPNFRCSGKGILQQKEEYKESSGTCDMSIGICNHNGTICNKDSQCNYCEKIITWEPRGSCSAPDAPTGITRCSGGIVQEKYLVSYCDATKCNPSLPIDPVNVCSPGGFCRNLPSHHCVVAGDCPPLGPDPKPDLSLCCGLKEVWKTKEVCPECAPGNIFCAGSNIVALNVGKTCKIVPICGPVTDITIPCPVAGYEAKCMPAVCQPQIIPCGPSNSYTVPLCSGGQLCNLTVNYPGTCSGSIPQPAGCALCDPFSDPRWCQDVCGIPIAGPPSCDALSVSMVCNGPCPSNPPLPPPPPPERHNECRGSTETGVECVMLWGSGPDMCNNANDCLSLHSECQWGPTGWGCFDSGGFGPDQCTDNASCVNGMHSECDNSNPLNPMCTAVSGTGPNTCNSALDCAYSYNICNSALGQCVLKFGIGKDQCTLNGNECANGQHNECTVDANTGVKKCEVKPGDGGNACANDKDCSDTYTQCNNQTKVCETKLGKGVNQCSNNLDCATPKYNICSGKKCVLSDSSAGIKCNLDTDCIINSCIPGSTQTCAGGGTQTCNPDGTWTDCPVCIPVWTYTETPCECGFKTINGINNCNNNTTSETQTCTYNNPLLGASNWGQCVNGQQTRMSTYQCTGDVSENRCCVDDSKCGQWIPNPCILGDQQSRSCIDNCGIMVIDTQICPICVPASTQNCVGGGTQTCNPDGTWGDCPPVCIPVWTYTETPCVCGLKTINGSNNCNSNTISDIQSCTYENPLTNISDWSECIDNQKTRTSTYQCTGPVTETQPCMCTPVWTYTETPCVCGLKTINGSNNCNSNTISDIQSCTYDNPLTNISDWSECIDNQKIRTSTYQCTPPTTDTQPCICTPKSTQTCEGGGTQTCTPDGNWGDCPPICVPVWTYLSETPCVCGIKTVSESNNCNNNINSHQENCTYENPLINISDWGLCVDNQQTKTLTYQCTGDVNSEPRCCVDNSNCGQWTPDPCVLGDQQSRSCTDNCGSTITDTRSCTCTVSSNQCSGWGQCVNGQRTRECMDNCGTKGSEAQVCCNTPPFCYTDSCFCSLQNEFCADTCFPYNQTITPQSCNYTPTETCGNWSACVNGYKNRICSSECGTKTETEKCVSCIGLDCPPPPCVGPNCCILSGCCTGADCCIGGGCCTPSGCCSGPDCCVGLDCPCTGPDCPKPPCTGPNCPCTGPSCPPPPCVGSNCPQNPCVGSGCPHPCVGTHCPCVNSVCPCTGSDCCLGAGCCTPSGCCSGPNCCVGPDCSCFGSKICPNEMIVSICDTCSNCLTKICPNGIITCNTDICPNCITKTCPNGANICETKNCPLTCTKKTCPNGTTIPCDQDCCPYSPFCYTDSCYCGYQNEFCIDMCVYDQTITSQVCSYTPMSDYCTEWSECVDGNETRQCSNECGTRTENQLCKCTPETTQTCDGGGTQTCNPDGTWSCCTQTCQDGSVICDTETCSCPYSPFCYTDSCYCGYQNEFCVDMCVYNQTITSQVCSYTPMYDYCGDWSACINSTQTRQCSNECETRTETQPCECVRGVSTKSCPDGKDIDSCDTCCVADKKCGDSSMVCQTDSCPTYCDNSSGSWQCTEFGTGTPCVGFCPPNSNHSECVGDKCTVFPWFGMGDTCGGITGINCYINLGHTECNGNNQCVSIPMLGIDRCQVENNGTANNNCDNHNVCDEASSKCIMIEGPGVSNCDNVGELCSPEKTHMECDIEKNCVELPGPGPQDCPVDCSLIHTECNRQNQCVIVYSEGTDVCYQDSDCGTYHTECNYFNQCVVIDESGVNQCQLDSDCTHTACELSGSSCQCVLKPGVGVGECQADLDCSSSPICVKKTVCDQNQCVPVDCQEGQSCDSDCTIQGNCCPAGSHTQCDPETQKCICKPGVSFNTCQTDENCAYHSVCMFDKCIVMDCKPGELCENSCDITNKNKDCEINMPPSATNLSVDKGNYCTGIPSAGITNFSWQYLDLEKDKERSFRFQVDDDQDFSSPEVDRFFDGMSVSVGSLNEQTVFVKSQPTIPYGDYIRYEIPYYWRVLVQEYNGNLKSDWIYYDGSKGTTDSKLKKSYIYGYLHPAPVVNFNFLPEAPIIGDNVNFIDVSICYNQTGPYACKGMPSGYSWTFGDNFSLSKSGDTLHSYASQGTFATSLQVCDEVGCCSSTKNVLIGNEKGTELPKFKEIPPY